MQLQTKIKKPIEWRVSHSMSSKQSYIYNTQQQYCLPGRFKTWYNNHTKYFRHLQCMNETELSKHVQNLKDHGLDNNPLLEIHKKVSPYQCGSKRCDLCLSEKYSIICVDPYTLLKKKTELISKCHHRNKFSSANVNK